MMVRSGIPLFEIVVFVRGKVAELGFQAVLSAPPSFLLLPKGDPLFLSISTS